MKTVGILNKAMNELINQIETTYKKENRAEFSYLENMMLDYINERKRH